MCILVYVPLFMILMLAKSILFKHSLNALYEKFIYFLYKIILIKNIYLEWIVF
jgi:hypothetical protein